MISILQSIFRPIFGDFEREEFKKFLRMGLIFTCIIGSYWSLRGLKNGLFNILVGSAWLPYAKTVSLILLVFLVMIYTKLLDRYSREKMFYMLSIFYAVLACIFALLIMGPFGQAPAEVVAARTGLMWWATKILGYSWYVFVESYGSLVIALFWAIASDTTRPESAKKGFPFVVAIGQIGGIIGPVMVGLLPRLLGFKTNGISIAVCAVLTFSVVWWFKLFLTRTPYELLTSFHGVNEKEEEKEQEPGFFEGLRLLVSHGYLLGIFAVISFFEIIVTVFDLHFQTLAATHYSGTALIEYLGWYGTSVNFVALLCLLLGVSNITRVLGVTVALIMMPLIVGAALIGFLTLNSLNFLFGLMVSSKAINYALNGPTLKLLYIPTTRDVRFKAQAWIEAFGSRSSKEAGSIFNMTLAPLQSRMGLIAGRARHVLLSVYMGFAIVIIWFLVAIYLGRTYKKAVDNKTVVC